MSVVSQVLAALSTLLPIVGALGVSSPGQDASRIAFVSDRDGNADIYVMNADGSNVTQLTTNPSYDGAPTWSPDGQRLAFASERDGNVDVYVIDADGSNEVRLTSHAAQDGGPSWSPDGSMIAFDSDRSGSSQVWRTNVEAGAWGYNLTQLTADHPLGRVNNFLSWSPNGRWIAFEADRDRDDPEIYLASAVDGTYQQRLTFTRALDEVPTWTPDSRQIVYSTDRDGEPQNGNYEIYIMNVDGSDRRRLTVAPGADSNPSVSPDGQRIVFDSSRDGATELYIMNIDGTRPIRLTNSGKRGATEDDGISNSNPAWSPR
jgi:TolB protein